MNAERTIFFGRGETLNFQNFTLVVLKSTDDTKSQITSIPNSWKTSHLSRLFAFSNFIKTLRRCWWLWRVIWESDFRKCFLILEKFAFRNFLAEFIVLSEHMFGKKNFSEVWPIQNIWSHSCVKSWRQFLSLVFSEQTPCVLLTYKVSDKLPACKRCSFF